MEKQVKIITQELGIKINLIISIILLILLLSLVLSNRFVNPVQRFYNVYSTGIPEASVEAHQLMYDYLDSNTYNEMVKTILLNHSFDSGYYRFINDWQVKENKELNEILRLTKEFYSALDTNITWTSYPFHIKKKKSSTKLIREWKRWKDDN